ncbi:MAG: sulfur carrier protein ThiS [Heliobacteriaceae bacterium]|jgi:sulfur carrier protein|nr:sulfur carrier protein ThiS [Heliobacteriaceae bacterium]
MSKMIRVNGRDVELFESGTIRDFITERKVTGTMFVIEKNGKIVNKEDYDSEPVNEGDSLELVGFVGGG